VSSSYGIHPGDGMTMRLGQEWTSPVVIPPIGGGYIGGGVAVPQVTKRGGVGGEGGSKKKVPIALFPSPGRTPVRRTSVRVAGRTCVRARSNVCSSYVCSSYVCSGQAERLFDCVRNICDCQWYVSGMSPDCLPVCLPVRVRPCPSRLSHDCLPVRPTVSVRLSPSVRVRPSPSVRPSVFLLSARQSGDCYPPGPAGAVGPYRTTETDKLAERG